MMTRAQNERKKKTFVFCIDYIEKMDNLCLKSYAPLFFYPK